MLAFQVPWLPEGMAEQDDCAMIVKSVHGKVGGVKNRYHLDKVDAQILRYEFSKPGVATSSMNYYRNVMVPGLNPILNKAVMTTTLPMPVLLIWGMADAFLDFSIMEDIGRVATRAQVLFNIFRYF